MSFSHTSRKVVDSAICPGVQFVVSRMTFGRRLELLRQIRDLAARLEYFEAGRDEKNRIEASLLGAEIDKTYVYWGIEQIRGLAIDGKPATVESLIDSAPEELFLEALAVVKGECGLSEHERKN